MIRQAKARAKKRGLPFDLQLGDLTIPAYCPVLGIPLSVGEGERHDGSPTLDRLVPRLGYVSGNVRVISYRANRIKNDGTLLELRAIVAWMEKEVAGEQP